MENFIFTIASIALIMLGIALSNLLYFSVRERIAREVSVDLREIEELKHRITMLSKHIIELESQLEDIKRGTGEEIPEWGRITQQDLEWG